MLSGVWLPQLNSWSAFSLVTDRSDISQTLRNERAVRSLHQQIAPLIGTKLSTHRNRTLDQLSVIRRQVLQALLDGLSEAEIAKKMFRSHSAVHEHVTAIYRHFGTRSRAELSAIFFHRRPVSDGKTADSQSLDNWLDRSWESYIL